MRRIGLGMMGVANVLYELGLSYNSTEGLRFMEKLMEFLNYHSKVVSIILAEKRGVPFGCSVCEKKTPGERCS